MERERERREEKEKNHSPDKIKNLPNPREETKRLKERRELSIHKVEEKGFSTK